MDTAIYKGYVVNKNGIVLGKNGNPLSIVIDNGGYAVVSIHNNIKRTEKVHRIIATCFLSNTENKPQVNHINGIKTDNRVENLEWVTRSENIRHAYKIGLMENARMITGINGSRSLIKNLSKKVIDTNNGKIYDSAKLAARENGINQFTLCHWLTGYRKNKSTLKYL